MTADPPPPPPPSATDWGVVLGLPALGLAGCDALVVAAAAVISQTDWRSGDLAERLSRMIFTYGFPLDLLAVVLAIGAICFGKRGRRMGLAAIALVAASFGLLLFT